MLKLIFDYLTQLQANIPSELIIGCLIGWSIANWLQKSRISLVEERLKLSEEQNKGKDNQLALLNNQIESLKSLKSRTIIFSDSSAPQSFHHVSLPVRDLSASAVFYEDILGLKRISKPDPDNRCNPSLNSIWFSLPNGQQLHLIDNPGGTYRHGQFDRRDCHYALEVSDFQQINRKLEDKGILRFTSDKYLTRYPNIYILDPDNHIIEINKDS
jgi:catechol 2,3-dioxygenase-like lactoylglutathione lyase family enzyme